MIRRLFFAIALIGAGVLLTTPVEAATALQCEEKNANCLGKCPNITGGAGDLRGHPNKCVNYCIRRLMTCYAISRR